MKSITRTIRSSILIAVFVSSLFASSVLAANSITASGERYTDARGNDQKTVSAEFRNIPAEYEGWQATVVESSPVCGVVTNGVVSCEFSHEDQVKGVWLHLYKKGTDQVASFYVSFHVAGMKQVEEEEVVEPVEEPVECNPVFEATFSVESIFVNPCLPQ